MQTSILNSLITRLKTLYSSHDTLPKLIDDEKIKAQSLEEYYVKLQILLSEDDEAAKAALRDKVVGEKKSVEIENIFKAIDTKEKIRELLKKELPNKDDEIDNIIRSFKAEKNKIDVLYRNLPNKRESEIKNIIESLARIQADVGKILLLGSAGIGKTTLMHYLSYKWGKGELWNDKFDYVFRVKLKELLNESWKDGYSGYFDINNLSQSKLNCFIHYCLGGSESTLSVKEIMDIQNKDKMLLLLDGYDEVAHLNTRDEFKKLIDNILEYKNVIMTSRPNAVVEEMSNRFERKVENTGWDSEGIEQYVNKNFEVDKELGTQLTSFLNTHSQIKEICKVPISTALICLVWSDKDIRDKFQKNSDEDFNISQLYHEVVIWLGKKYFQKFENKRIVNITDGQILSTPELQFLQEIAFEALVATGKLVTHQLIKAKLNDKDFTILNIEKINKLGLLKAEGTGESIINLNHQFIHLTFQEYLAACYLKNQLKNEEDKSKEASFIGKHRNDPKYLMTLKFLAGMVNNENNQELIEIFWEAAICNVDGILELGIERKIILLMHLLAQSKINRKFDSRIPYLKQIQELIDEIVLKDITIWEQHIIDSGYLSEEIVKTVNEKLRKSKTDFQELKTSAEIIAALANKHEWGSKTKVYERLISSLKIEDWQLKELVLQKLAQILDGTIDEVVVKRSLKKILLLLNTSELKEYVNIIFAKIITVTPDLGKEILNQLQKKEFFVINSSLIKIVQAIPTQKAFVFLKNLPANLNYKIKHATACALFFLIKEMSIQEARIKLKELLANPTRENKYAAAATLPQIIKEMPSLAPQIITFLKEEIINPNSEYNTKHIAIESITKIVKILPNLVQEIFDILKMVITNPYSEYNTKSEAVKSLADIVKVKPNLTQEVVNFLKSLIINFNNEYEIKAKAVENILEIIEVTPNLAQETFTFLKEIITNPKFNYDVKIVAIENIVGIVEVKPSLAQETFSFLKLVITNFNINYNAKLNAIESIATIVEVKPNLAQEAFTFLKVLTMNPKTNIYIKTKAIESITEILEIIPSLAQEAFTLLKVEIINSNANYNVDSITKSITQIIKLKPILEAFTFLKNAIMNANVDKHVKVKAVKSIAEIVKAEPSLTQEAFTFSKAAIMNTNIDKHVKVKTIKSMAEIVKAEPSLTQEAFIFLKEVIVNSDIDYDIKEIAYYNIEEIVKVMPSLSFETFTFFKERITNHSSNDIGYNATRGIVAMAKVNQSLAKEAFIILRNILSNLNNYHENIMHAAGTSLVELMELIPFDKTCYKQVHELLKIIKLTWHKDFHNGLYIEATLTLHKITHHLTQEYEQGKNPEVIEWFNKCFNELPNISETRIFLKEICKSILKGGAINELESKFILHCMQKYNFTFTVSVNKEPGIEGKIIFEDRNYEIFTTDNSASKIVSLEEFTTKLLAETDDPLAEQYKTHKPLFPNKGVGLKIAASDINYVSSIANENRLLA